MKIFRTVFCLLFLAAAAWPQNPDEVLATAKGLTFTASSLSEQIRKAYTERHAAVAAERSRLFSEVVTETLLDAEARAQGTTRKTLVAAASAGITDPSAAAIKTIYDANRQAFGDRNIEQARPQIIAFLRGNAEQKAIDGLVEKLKTKHKFVSGKDINATALKPADIVFSVAGKPFTAGEFNNKFKAHLYDVEAEIALYAIHELDAVIFSTLIAQEAKSRNIEPGDLIATEITNKLRDFTPEERAGIENALKKRLYEKYAVKITLREPEPVAHDVSADDDPVFGKPAAPVTVVMFSDFQCSACAATHPVLKNVLGAFPDKAKLVVRDFPLESIHENAFRAALAANAAQQQGKYFEFIDLLYQNQDRLDDASLKGFAAQLGLNPKQFELDFSSEKTAAEVRKDIADGVRHGTRGTPTIFINGVRVHHLSTDGLRGGIERALAGTGSK